MKNEVAKFELALRLNDNFVCQRYFTVKDYNPKIRRSVEIYEAMNYVKKIIIHNLYIKSSNYITEIYNGQYGINAMPTIDYETQDNLILELKLGNTVISQSAIDISQYPSKVRYNIDIRGNLHNIIDFMTETLSLDEVTSEYLGTKL